MDQRRGLWMRWLVVMLLGRTPGAEAQDASQQPSPAQALEEGNSQAKEFFKALHRRLGEGAR